MREIFVDGDIRTQDSQQSPFSSDYRDQAPPQPNTSQDDRTEVPPAANSGQEPASQEAPTVALTGDESRLSRVVVIPQRRPSDRARGFVRAYAPDLLRCGISQETFLQFVDGLNNSVASNAAVEAVNIAGEAVGAIPGSEFVGAPIVGMALQVAAGAYKEVNARRGYVLPLFLFMCSHDPCLDFLCYGFHEQDYHGGC